MPVLTYDALDEVRKNTLNEVAAKINQNPEEILNEVPFAIALYGRFINPKALGGYFKRLVDAEGNKLAPNQVIEKQMQDDMDSDPNFQHKAKIALKNPFVSLILSIFFDKSVNELADPTTGEIKNLHEVAELLAINPGEEKEKTLLAMAQGPEFQIQKDALSPEFEELKASSISYEQKEIATEVAGGETTVS